MAKAAKKTRLSKNNEDTVQSSVNEQQNGVAAEAVNQKKKFPLDISGADIKVNGEATPSKKQKKHKKKDPSKPETHATDSTTKLKKQNNHEKYSSETETNGTDSSQKSKKRKKDVSRTETKGTDSITNKLKKQKKETDLSSPSDPEEGGSQINGDSKTSKKEKKGKKEASAKSKSGETPAESKPKDNVVPEIGATFESLRDHLSAETMLGIEGFGFSELTEVQQKTIPLLLSGRDVRGTAKTGSGKTLAFLIPAIEKIKDCTTGLSCIVLSPTRELALQTYCVVKALTKYHSNINTAIVIGGTKIENEKRPALQANLLVATPGRLLDHLKHTKGFKTNKLKVLIVDEADRMLDEGFEKELHQILQRLPKGKRQSVLFSATVTSQLSRMTVLTLNDSYHDINLTAHATASPTADGLTQTYLPCPTFQRLLVLHKILTENKDSKVMVFVNTCDGVNFYKKLLNQLNLTVHGIHGRQGQQIRSKLFSEFCSAYKGVLLCTDIAARGWDIPAINLILQFDPPSDVNEYIHRVGRCVRREGETGKAVMLLRPEEMPLLDVLKKKNVTLTEYQDIDMYALDFDVQTKADGLVSTDSGLQTMGIAAYRNFLTAYSVLQPRHIYDNRTIPTKELAKNFGLDTPPQFNFSRLPLNYVARDEKRSPKPASQRKLSKKKNKKLKSKQEKFVSVSGRINSSRGGGGGGDSLSKEEKKNQKKKFIKERRKQRRDERMLAEKSNESAGAPTEDTKPSTKYSGDGDASEKKKKTKKRKSTDDSTADVTDAVSTKKIKKDNDIKIDQEKVKETEIAAKKSHKRKAKAIATE